MKKLNPIVPRLAAVTLGLVTACSGKSAPNKGQIMVAISTDMAVPDDVKEIDIMITDKDGSVLENIPIIFDRSLPKPPLIPGTYAIVEGSQDKQGVSIRLVARSDSGAARIVREATTTIPAERTAQLWMPVEWLCDGMVSGDGDASLRSDCGDGETCVLGECVDSTVDSDTLPDFDAEDVFGGAGDGGLGGCFDTEACFASAEPVPSQVLDLENCVVALPPGEPNVNMALHFGPDGPGYCVGEDCYVPLSYDSEGKAGWVDVEFSAFAPSSSIECGSNTCDPVDPGTYPNTGSVPLAPCCIVQVGAQLEQVCGASAPAEAGFGTSCIPLEQGDVVATPDPSPNGSDTAGGLIGAGDAGAPFADPGMNCVIIENPYAQLPKAVCRKLREGSAGLRGISFSTACETKPATVPPCSDFTDPNVKKIQPTGDAPNRRDAGPIGECNTLTLGGGGGAMAQRELHIVIATDSSMGDFMSDIASQVSAFLRTAPSDLHVTIGTADGAACNGPHYPAVLTGSPSSLADAAFPVLDGMVASGPGSWAQGVDTLIGGPLSSAGRGTGVLIGAEKTTCYSQLMATVLVGLGSVPLHGVDLSADLNAELEIGPAFEQTGGAFHSAQAPSELASLLSQIVSSMGGSGVEGGGSCVYPLPPEAFTSPLGVLLDGNPLSESQPECSGSSCFTTCDQGFVFDPFTRELVLCATTCEDVMAGAELTVEIDCGGPHTFPSAPSGTGRVDAGPPVQAQCAGDVDCPSGMVCMSGSCVTGSSMGGLQCGTSTCQSVDIGLPVTDCCTRQQACGLDVSALSSVGAPPMGGSCAVLDLDTVPDSACPSPEMFAGGCCSSEGFCGGLTDTGMCVGISEGGQGQPCGSVAMPGL